MSCFGKHVETKFDHPQFSSILAPKNLNETKSLPLASMGKHEDIRANTMTQISYRLLCFIMQCSEKFREN